MATTDLINLAATKLYLGVTHDSDDVLITMLISSASRAIERYAQTAFVHRTITQERQLPKGRRQKIYLNRGPIVSVTTVEDEEGNEVPADQFFIHHEDAVLVHKYSWPVPNVLGSEYYLVTYVAGRYANTDEVDDDLKLAARMLVALRYSRRVPNWRERLGDFEAWEAKDMPWDIEMLIAPYRSIGV